MITTKRILKEIGNPNLKMYRGDGYIYFAYDDSVKIFETHSVYVNTLQQLSLESWVEEGKNFCEICENIVYNPTVM